MIINLKYYVITIIAIFLAIGIGIFIGIMLDGQDLIVEQQQQLVSQLQSKFDEFKAKQDELQERIDYLSGEREKNIKFIEKVYPHIVHNKLKDLDVAIIETNEEYSYVGLNDALEKAGVQSISSIYIKSNFILKDLNYAQQLSNELNISGDTLDEIQNQLVQLFCNAMISGHYQTINSFKEKGLIDYIDKPKLPVDYLVIAGGSSTDERSILKKIDIPIITKVKSNGVPIMAVEKTNVAHSNIQDYKKVRVSTVDNVDTVIGKVSMMMVLSGQEGHFGEKQTAEALVPEGFLSID